MLNIVKLYHIGQTFNFSNPINCSKVREYFRKRSIIRLILYHWCVSIHLFTKKYEYLLDSLSYFHSAIFVMPLVFILNITTDNQQYVYFKKLKMLNWQKCECHKWEYWTDKNENVTNAHFCLYTVKNTHIYRLCLFLTALFKWLEIISGWFLNIVHDKGVITFR